MPEPLAITTPRISLNGAEDTRFSDATLELSIVQPADGRDIAEVRLVDLGEHGEGPKQEFTDLRLADRLEITVGDPDSPVLFSGRVVAIEERYGDGAPQLVLIAHDALHALAARRRSQAWEDQAPAAVVRSLGSDAGLECDVQLPEEIGRASCRE